MACNTTCIEFIVGFARSGPRSLVGDDRGRGGHLGRPNGHKFSVDDLGYHATSQVLSRCIKAKLVCWAIVTLVQSWLSALPAHPERLVACSTWLAQLPRQLPR